MNWFAIDTAPRDHSIIRGRDADGDIFLCQWWSGTQKAEYVNDGQEWESQWLDPDDPDSSYDPIFWQPIQGAN